MAVAQDTGGEAAAGRYYDEAGATFTTLLDPMHVVTSLYRLSNVPSGVWIDEEGSIVRPPEVAYTEPISFGSHSGGDERYVEALIDWVDKGPYSLFSLTTEDVQERLGSPHPDRALADAHFKLGAFLFARDDEEEARAHWEEAQRLDPSNWNYHRQDWSFLGDDKRRELWQTKVDALTGRPYYRPVDLPDPQPDR